MPRKGFSNRLRYVLNSIGFRCGDLSFNSGLSDFVEEAGASKFELGSRVSARWYDDCEGNRTDGDDLVKWSSLVCAIGGL